MLVVPVPHDMGSNEEVFLSMVNDWRGIFGRAASDFAKFLFKWGFLDAERKAGKLEINRKQLSRYLATAASETLVVLFKLKQKMEKEKKSAS